MKIPLEIAFLQKDLEFFDIQLPKTLDLGFLCFDFIEIHKIFKETLNSYISELKALLESHFHSLLITEEKKVQELMDLLAKTPTNLNQYIELSQYLSGQEFKTIKEILERNISKLKTLFLILEDCQILCKTEDLSIYFGSFSWLNQVFEVEKHAKSLLQERKGKFRIIVSSETMKIFEEFKDKKQEITILNGKIDGENIYQNANQSKQLMQELMLLDERAKKANENQEYLGYEITDFLGFSLGN